MFAYSNTDRIESLDSYLLFILLLMTIMKHYHTCTCNYFLLVQTAGHKMMKSTKLTIFKPLILYFDGSLLKHVSISSEDICSYACYLSFKKDDLLLLFAFRPTLLLLCVKLWKDVHNYFHSNELISNWFSA